MTEDADDREFLPGAFINVVARRLGAAVGARSRTVGFGSGAFR
jgi:hypothetical protein